MGTSYDRESRLYLQNSIEFGRFILFLHFRHTGLTLCGKIIVISVFIRLSTDSEVLQLHDRIKRILLAVWRFLSGAVLDILSLAAKIAGTLLLILVTTGMIFACIFVVYIKNNMDDTLLNVDLSEVKLNQTSIIYRMDPDTNDYIPTIHLDALEDRVWVSYENFPEDLEHAVVAIEDKRFYTHNGVDWFRTIQAFFNMFLHNSDTFGGSTITQQLIKNTTERDEVTVQRKFMEIFSALRMEQNYSKQEILEWYLNKVYFGSGKYGIGSAANYYFGKDVQDLTLAEAASIVGITNNPSLYSPYIDPEANKSRQVNILNQMMLQGYITYDEFIEAKNEPLVFTSGSEESSTTSDGVYSYFEDAIIEDVIHTLMDLKNCDYDTAELLLTTGGYRIYSTEDVTIQAIVDDVYGNLENVPETWGSDQQLQSAIVITNPYTGDIVAMAGGVGQKLYNRSQNLATQTRRPPGSSFKPLAVYAPAMDLGLITPDTKFEDSKDVKLNGTSWMTVNYERSYKGVLTLREGIVNSTNTVAAQVLDMITPQVSYDFLTQKLGITSLVEYEEEEDGRIISDIDYAPLALGQLSYGITVREMAEGYSIFPNSGVHTVTRTFTKICDSNGSVIYDNVTRSNVAISDTTAYWMTDILQDVATYGTGAAAYMGNMPVGGKTGTTDSEEDRWFVGFTPYYVAAVWTGYEYPEYIHAYGINPAVSLWTDVMTRVHENLEYRDFPVPENTYQTPVPGVTEVHYTIRGITDTGVLLYEDSTGKGVEDREIEVTARAVEGYTLVGQATIKFKLQRSDVDNVITFVYRSNTPPSPSPSPSPSPTPTIVPTPTSTPPPTTEPTPEPTTTPEETP